jgi:hypothetical protein
VPVQLMGATFSLVFIWLLDRASKRWLIPGLSASIGLFGLSAVVFGLSYLRADPTPIWQGLRLEAWGAIGVMIFSTLAVVVLLLGWKFNK